MWHPVSYVRQQMLKYAFSYLPVRMESSWWLIPEYSVARYLRGAPSQKDRKRRLATPVGDAVAAKELHLLEVNTANPKTLIDDILQRIDERPILVVDPGHEDVLIGVLTSSDVL